VEGVSFGGSSFRMSVNEMPLAVERKEGLASLNENADVKSSRRMPRRTMMRRKERKGYHDLIFFVGGITSLWALGQDFAFQGPSMGPATARPSATFPRALRSARLSGSTAGKTLNANTIGHHSQRPRQILLVKRATPVPVLHGRRLLCSALSGAAAIVS
jgi:hypothetical protein